MMYIPTVLFDLSIFENDNKPKRNSLRSKDQSNFARFTELLKKEFFHEGFFVLCPQTRKGIKSQKVVKASICSPSYILLLNSQTIFRT